jgi:parallel beta-helix repeat protein
MRDLTGRAFLLIPFFLAVASTLGSPGAAAGPARTYDGGVIAGDTVWKGTVTVVGPLVVKKGATLTVEPGTIVRFEWPDEDGNGIGDGELIVEGRLIARGTPEEMITFTSGRDEPRMKDWTYVMISLSRDSLVEYCLFEHAFTGLQVHLSSAVIRNSIFRRNFEALRFSTADLLVEGNHITDNTYGIRYESRDSDTAITGNEISGNEYAFFPVVKCTSSVRIFENNITSTGYNVKMGQRQSADLDFGRNWWGTVDAAVIEAGFFDGRRDRSLGLVRYTPFLTAPMPDGGIR